MKVSTTILREMAIELDRMYSNPIQYEPTYVVLLMWKSPIGNYIDARTAAFQSCCDAEDYAKYLSKKYSDMGFAYRITINGDEYIEEGFYDVIDKNS